MARPLSRFFNFHPLLTSYLFVASFSVIYQALIYSSGMAGSVGLRQGLLMSSLWLIPLLLWPKHYKSLSLLIVIFLLPASLISFGYWLLYGQDFSQSVIFIIFETNWAESKEFLQSYIRWWHPLAFAAYLLLPLYFWRQLRPVHLSNRSRYLVIGFLSIIISWPFFNTLTIKHDGVDAAVYHQLQRMEPASPWSLVVGFWKYRQVVANMEKIISHNAELAPLSGFAINPEKLPKRLVLVIGESTNSQRMGIYGYHRQTTPELNNIREQLTVFNNVITPRPFTIEALQQVLSFANQTNPDDIFTGPNLLNVLRQAGYHTTWITNQQTQTRRNTLLTSLAQMADEQIYLNNNHAQNARQYDDVVLTPFGDVLNQPHERQAIIIHLLGTHRKYYYRYPPEYDLFNSSSDLPEWVTDDLAEEYNNYDNAIIFNDHVVNQLISALREAGEKSLLVYFSDHGEEVYDYPEPLFCGRNEDRPTPAMYTVPLIIWQSDTGTERDLHPYENRPYQSSDLIYTLADIMGIRFDSWDATRSLINPKFTPHERLIGDPHGSKLKDYDQLMSSWVIAAHDTSMHQRLL